MIFSGNLDEALEQLTEAIMLNPQSAILYATRGAHSLCVFLFQIQVPFDKFLSVLLSYYSTVYCSFCLLYNLEISISCFQLVSL